MRTLDAGRQPGRAPGTARIRFRPVDAGRDAPVLHGWLTHPRNHFWGMSRASLDDVRRAYRRIGRATDQDAWIGELDGEPMLLAETYDPAHSPLAGRYPGRPGDLGMHILVAPTDRPVHGFTDVAMAAVMRMCLSRPGIERIVVEPDVRNAAIQVKNRAAGFVVHGRIELPDKTALLCTATARQFTDSRLGRL